MIQRQGSRCATLPLLTSFGRTPATNVAPPRGWLLRCSYPRLGVQIRDEVCVVQRAPSSHCVLGRTPATHVAPPRGWLLRCPNPRLGSLFAAQGHRRPERESHVPRKRLITNPRRGLRRPAAGVRPSTQCEKGGRCTTHTPSCAAATRRGRVAQHKRPLMQRPRASHNTYARATHTQTQTALHNTNALSYCKRS